MSSIKKLQTSSHFLIIEKKVIMDKIKMFRDMWKFLEQRETSFYQYCLRGNGDYQHRKLEITDGGRDTFPS